MVPPDMWFLSRSGTKTGQCTFLPFWFKIRYSFQENHASV